MMRSPLYLTVLILLSSTLSFVPFSDSSADGTVVYADERDIHQMIMERDHFIEDRGQLTREDIDYYSTGEIRAGFTDGSVVYAQGVQESYSYEVVFSGCNGKGPAGMEERLTKYNYFRGNDRDKWVTDAGSYDVVMYEDLWDDIDMKYYSMEGSLKYDIIVKPGADLSKVSFEVIGADIHTSPDGSSMIFDTPLGRTSDGGLYAYQGEEV